jgi:hypothetical protein
MKWKHPPKTKIYEALGAVADGRVEVSGNAAKVYSSSRNKFYDVTYDPEAKAIMANDNASYWKGYLGYPSIAYLMATGVVSYDPALGALLAGVAWKDINQNFKNDFDAALESILSPLTEDERAALAEYVETVDTEIKVLDLGRLGKRALPPEGY